MKKHLRATAGGATPDRIRTRRLEAKDAAALHEVFHAMSPDSRYQRFHTSTSRLTAKMQHHLLDVDGAHHRAVLAEVAHADGWRAIGIARYIVMAGPEPEAEAAVEVADDWQGRGVGIMLLRQLFADARRAGVCRLVGNVLPDNRRVVELIREHFSPPVISLQDGTLRVAVQTC